MNPTAPQPAGPLLARRELLDNRQLLDVDRLERAAMGEDAPAYKPVPAAYAFLEDRLNRVEHMLGNLNGVIMRLGNNLGPVLTDGTYRDPDDQPVPASPALDTNAKAAHDDRSHLAKRISELALYADRLGDVTNTLALRVEAIDAAVEL